MQPRQYEKLYPDLPPLNVESQDDDNDDEADEEQEEFLVPNKSPGKLSAASSETSKTPLPGTNDFNIAYAVVLIIAVLIGISCPFLYKHFSKRDDTSVTSKKDWKHIVTKLHPHLLEKGDKFPSQNEDVWYKILAGLQGLLNDPKRPAVYLLTYDDGSAHPASCVAEIITTAANNYLLDKNGWSLLNGTLLIGSEIEDPGELIKAIAVAAEQNKIIVVTDVQDIPAKLAQGFHFLVDEYTPKVAEAIYVLTLKIPSYLKQQTPIEAAEETLKESWKELSLDTLQPLITRMTVQVLPIVAEKSEKRCPLKTSVTSEIYLS